MAEYKSTYTGTQIDAGIAKANTAIQDVSNKQDTLVSGTNIKTINNQSLLGSGNLEIGGGSGSGLTTEQKTALNDIIIHIGAWTDGNAQTYIANFQSAFDISGTNYNISYNLTNCTSSNANTTIAKNSAYTTTISANDNYTLGNVTCVMGDVPQTVNNGVVNIPSVTGNITITASATENLKYTVTNNLSNITNENTNTQVYAGTSYNALLTANVGYAIDSVTITMNAVDVTSNTYDPSTHLIAIDSVEGNIVITATSKSAVTHNVTYNLSNITSSNTNIKANDGEAYTTTLTPSSGHEVDTVTVTMNNVDITSSAYNSSTNVITINAVTGDIVITATATAGSVPFTDYSITEGAFITSSGAFNTNNGYNTAYFEVLQGEKYTVTAMNGKQAPQFVLVNSGYEGGTDRQTVIEYIQEHADSITQSTTTYTVLSDGCLLIPYYVSSGITILKGGN